MLVEKHNYKTKRTGQLNSNRERAVNNYCVKRLKKLLLLKNRNDSDTLMKKSSGLTFIHLYI